MNIGQKLNYIRDTERVTLQTLSQKLEQKYNIKIKPQTLSRYENGERKPPISYIGAFGDIFNVSGDWLLYETRPIYRKEKNGTRNIKDVYDELTALLPTYKVKKKEVDFEKLTHDTLENQLLLLKAMNDSQEVKEKILRFFHMFL